ncbi:PAS domain S-box-containing protein [Flavobacterium sp. CG_23.5]|uniref:PAS domain S-box protein n=1 Tax=Flavobacterium sp. CG_23.5 TaxID=2760708 RepID=UPI001AE9D15E|nr:PAS domain S-box protein [Flavobacterium sp. CG_23.5]MBP2284654.1 PAS domain S-box-containing protein [Flavobacterium sp. CG_23.5]
MKNPKSPRNEYDRLQALESYSIMDSLPEKEYDSITQLASYICGTPIALVSLLDGERQWFKSSVGLGIAETPRDISFCQYAIMGEEVYEINNASENELFANNPLVTGGPKIQFYAGAPLQDVNGFNLGSLCVIDTVPRILTDEQKNALTLLANQVVLLLDLRKKNIDLKTSQQEFQNFIELSKDLVCIANVDGTFLKVNPSFTTVLGYSKEELVGQPFANFIHPDDLEKTYKEVTRLAEGHKTISFENRYRCKNGEYIVLSWNTSPDPVSGNLYCIARDMTLEYQQKEKLVKTSSELSAILNSTDFSIISSDLDGTIKEFNRGAEKLLGYQSEEVVGKTSPSIFHLWDEVVKRTEDLTKEFGENLVPGYDTFVLNARTLGAADSNEWTYVRKDGSLIPVVLSVTAIKDNQGEIAGYLGISKDITKEKEAELNLINSNKLFDESQSIAKTGSWKFDLLTKDLIWSKGNYKIFEFEELPANKLYDAYRKILRPEALVELDKKIEKSVTTGQDFEFLNNIEFSNDRVKYILTLGQIIKNEFGDVIGAQGSTQDITEKMLAEQNLVNSNKLLDESQSIAKIGSWKFNLTTKDLMLSKGHYTIFELDGVPADQLYMAYRSRILPEDLAKLDEFDENVIKTGENYKTDYRILFPDNRIKYIQEIGQPFKNEKGEIIGLQGSILDITEKALAEQKIAEKAKEINDIRSALDESTIVTITDQKGVITFVNDKFCSISQYSKEELIGQYHYVNNPEYQLNKFIKNIWKTIANGKVWKGDIKNRAKDGSYYWVDSTIVPFLDNEGKPYQYIAISSDITDQKLAKENLNLALTTLEKKNKELDQFAYIISHDLKAPLRAINNLSEWIVEDMPEMPEAVNANFGLLRGRILRMENLINGVLDYSRIGRTKIEKETTDLTKMLNQIVDSIVPTEGFEIYIADNIPEIKIARILFQQIFSNLISNAVKYNDKPIGKIECLYESLPDFHQFTIKDNGPGIEEEYHKKVFKVFQTIEARDKKESTGIGLSIVQKIIEEAGGSIRIESKENKGASFIFTIPKSI